MFHFKYLSVLFKESGMLESLMSMNTQIILTVNGTQTHTSPQSQIKDRLAVWKSNTFGTIHLDGFVESIGLEFVIFKNSEQIGRAKSIARLGYNKKDCLDLADRRFHIVGKFVYEIVWSPYAPKSKIMPMGNNQMPTGWQYPTSLAVNSVINPYYQASNTNINLQKNPTYAKTMEVSEWSKKPKEREKVVKKHKSGFSTTLCCMGLKRQKPKSFKVPFANEVIMMTEEQLGPAPSTNPSTPSLEVQYYSKKVVQKHQSN